MQTYHLQKLGFYLIKLIISSFAVYITGWLLSGVHIGYPAYLNSLLIAFVLLILNKYLKPVLVILTIPVTLFSFGLFLLIINALIILLASEFVESFTVDGFWTALFFSIILSIVTSLLEAIGRIKVITPKNKYYE
jgi:putative membrane protein